MVVGRLGLIAGLVSFVAFLVVTALVFSNTPQNLDAELALAINNLNLGETFTRIMVLSAEYGREYFWIPVVGVMLILGNKGTKLLALELAALFAAGIVFGEVMKFVTYRPRPFETIDAIIRRVPIDTDSSYPSGHALIVSIGATFSLVKFKRSVALLFTLEAAIVCYSRVYVGMHYPMDVVAGIVLAVTITGVSLFILNRYLSRLLAGLGAISVKLFKDGPLNL